MKGFKYLFFTNKIKQPFYNFWFFKKLTAGEEDDGNLLTVPNDYEYGGVKWSWNKFNATGSGNYARQGGGMCAITPLKETLSQGDKCIFSIAEPYAYNLRITLSGVGGNIRTVLNKGETSVQINVTHAGTVDFQVFCLAPQYTHIDETIKGFKLVKAE